MGGRNRGRLDQGLLSARAPLVPSSGLEPEAPASEASILSIELRGHGRNIVIPDQVVKGLAVEFVEFLKELGKDELGRLEADLFPVAIEYFEEGVRGVRGGD